MMKVDINLLAHIFRRIMWHEDPLLGNNRETNSYTMAVIRQRPVNCNR
jgi:hypothetical protein